MMKLDITTISTVLTEWLLTFLAEHTEEYAEIQKHYQECLAKLNTQYGDTMPDISDVPVLIKERTAAEAMFSFYLGMKANMEVFHNPVFNNFLNKDFEDFLMEERLPMLPSYRTAQQKLDKIFEAIPKKSIDDTVPITEYESLLKTTVPKLAHYYGFLYGNAFFPCVEPGYFPDMSFTFRYKRMLEHYMQIDLPDVEILY